MIDDQAYIVVVQSRLGGEVLNKIESKRTANSKNHVFLTASHGQAGIKVEYEPVDIVITGQCLYRLIQVVDDDDPMLSTMKCVISRGTFKTCLELSEEIHRAKPEILIFRYSSDPYGIGMLTGEIEISEDHGNLIDLINSEELPEILKTKDMARFKERFPRIRFFDKSKRDIEDEINYIRNAKSFFSH